MVGEPSGGKTWRVIVEKSLCTSSLGSAAEMRPTVKEMPSLMLIIIFHDGCPLKMVWPCRCLRCRTLCRAGAWFFGLLFGLLLVLPRERRDPARR